MSRYVSVDVPGDLDSAIANLNHDIDTLSGWVQDGKIRGNESIRYNFPGVLNYWQNFQGGTVECPFRVRLSDDLGECREKRDVLHTFLNTIHEINNNIQGQVLEADLVRAGGSNAMVSQTLIDVVKNLLRIWEAQILHLEKI